MKINIEALYNLIEKKINISDFIEKLTILGFETTKIENYLDINIPYNRQDCNNIVSILNEIKNFDKNFLFKLAETKIINVNNKNNITIKIEDKHFCPLYAYAIIDNINIQKHIPSYIKENLYLNNISSINSLVDIINYSTIITGQPFHCYDINSLNKNIQISKNTEKDIFYSINDLKIKLPSDIFLIKSKNKVISIPGIIGAYNSKISENTKSILLESAYFKEDLIKNLSEKLKIKTESSERFSKGINFDLTINSLNYALNLITNILNCKIRYTHFKRAKNYFSKSKKIIVNKNKLFKLLNGNFNDINFLNCINDINFKKRVLNSDIVFYVPNNRKDLKIEENIFSEIVKLYGFNNIVPSKLKTVHVNNVIENDINYKIAYFLKNIGFNEIISYSFVDNQNEKFFTDKNDYIYIKNPISEKMNIMRNTLLNGIMKSTIFNINRQNNNLNLFEIGNIYEKSKLKNFIIENTLSMIITEKNSKNNEFFYIKSIITELLNSIYNIKGIDIFKNNYKYFNTEISASIVSNGKEIGNIGLINKNILNAYSIKQNVYACSLFLDRINYNVLRVFKDLSKYPYVIRDLSIILKENIIYKDIVNFIYELKIKNLINIFFLDFYNTNSDIRSLTLRFKFVSKIKTLLDSDVFSSMILIQKNLKSKFNVEIRT